MKKVILALAIVSVTFAACNDNASKTETTSDTTTVVTPSSDTTMVVKDTTVTTTIDTLKK